MNRLPWIAPLREALCGSGSAPALMQLATVGSAGNGGAAVWPECRTLAFRGFLFDPLHSKAVDARPQAAYEEKEDSTRHACAAPAADGLMRFTTDRRMAKLRAIQQRPVGELCW